MHHSPTRLPLLALALAFAGCSHAPAKPTHAAPAARTTPASAPAPAPAAAAAPAPAMPGRARVLTVVTLNDFHGSLEPRILHTAGNRPVHVGGAALIESYVTQIRRTAPGPVLLVDAGDLFQGTLVSNLAEGAPVIDFYNHLGMQASAVGNHEFDYGPVGPDPVVSRAGQDPRGALKARVAQAHFPFLACNIHDKDGKVPDWLKPSVMLDVGGIKVGVVGASTPETPATTVRANLTGLTFLDPAKPVIAEAKRLRSDGAKVVVVLLHGGSRCPGTQPADDLSKCEPGDLTKLVTALPDGLVDVLVAGHTHQRVLKRKGRMVIIEAYAYGQYLGVSRVPVGGAAQPSEKLVHVCGETVPGHGGPSCDRDVVRSSTALPLPAHFRGATMRPDPAVEDILAPALARVRKVRNRPIGVQLPHPIDGAYAKESPLGDLVADVFRSSVPLSDIGVTNGGGLRSGLPAGPLTYGSVYEAMPFDNRLAVLTVSGRKLLAMIELGVREGHGALSWSGLTFRADGCRIRNVRVHGRRLRQRHSYQVVTNDFLANGGSGFASLHLKSSDVRVLWERPYVRDVVARALGERGQDLIQAAYQAAARPRQQVSGVCPVAVPPKKGVRHRRHRRSRHRRHR